jgi:NAD kinase
MSTSTTTLAPRAVVVTRRSELDELTDRHGTRRAAEFFLRSRGRDLDEVRARHAALDDAVATVTSLLPADWRRGHVERGDLDRFLFAPEDVIVVVGQDGLVANAAKYLDGQPIVGIDPEPGRNAGVLVTHTPAEAGDLLRAVGEAEVEERTMVRAETDDGQHLVALNEVYVGDTTHQSARYLLTVPGGQSERQSSSGVLVGTGTGATGWCASVARERADAPEQPEYNQAMLCWFVREAWPSPATGTALTAGNLSGDECLELVAESERLVVFGDGIESDRIALAWGQRVRLSISATRCRLV